MTSIRTFIAFDTPNPIREKILSLQSELKKANADVKWEPQEKFHATIKFLGNVNESILPDVIAKVQSVVVNSSAFDVTYQTLGSFPDKNNPRVIWIGCENPDGKLQSMKKNLDSELLTFGFEIEKRSFHPHITLGRVKSSRGIKHLTPMLEKLTFEPHEARIHGILVMKSTLKPQGSVYEILKEIQLTL